MFQHEVDWKTVTMLICDIMRGSSSLSVQHHSSVASGKERQTHFSKWRYEQTQPHQATSFAGPRLFSSEQLQALLVGMSNAETFFAYETSAQSLGETPETGLTEFSSIEMMLVTLTVGSVVMSWALVSLGQPRDLILWKMKYHLRDANF